MEFNKILISNSKQLIDEQINLVEFKIIKLTHSLIRP